jgi:hypothetical protein
VGRGSGVASGLKDVCAKGIQVTLFAELFASRRHVGLLVGAANIAAVLVFAIPLRGMCLCVKN